MRRYTTTEFVREVDAAVRERGWAGGGTPAGMVRAWEALVEQLEEGYDDYIDEYWNDLSIRDAIEAVLSDPRLARYPQLGEFRRNIERLDERFRPLLKEEPQIGEPGDPWWRRHVLAEAGADFARDVWELYEIEIRVRK